MPAVEILQLRVLLLLFLLLHLSAIVVVTDSSEQTLEKSAGGRALVHICVTQESAEASLSVKQGQRMRESGSTAPLNAI